MEWKEPVKVELHNNLMLYAMPPPGSGVLTAYIMNILDGHLVKDQSREAGKAASWNPVTYHRIAEAFKHAYAWRTKLADPAFVPEVQEVSLH